MDKVAHEAFDGEFGKLGAFSLWIGKFNPEVSFLDECNIA